VGGRPAPERRSLDVGGGILESLVFFGVFLPELSVLGCNGGGTRVGDEGCDWKVLAISVGLLSLGRVDFACLDLLLRMGRVGLCCPDQVVFALLAVDGLSLNAEFAPLTVLECRSESLSFPLTVLA
jgi:hypothetical protein